MAFWAAAIPIIQAVGGALMKDDAKKKSQQFTVPGRSQGVAAPQGSDSGMGDLAGLAQAGMEAYSGAKGAPTSGGPDLRGEAIQNRIDAQNAPKIFEQGMTALQSQPPDVQAKYGPYIEEAMRRSQQKTYGR